MYELFKELYAKYGEDIHKDFEVVSPDPRTLNLYYQGEFVGRFHSAFNCITEMLHRSVPYEE